MYHQILLITRRTVRLCIASLFEEFYPPRTVKEFSHRMILGHKLCFLVYYSRQHLYWRLVPYLQDIHLRNLDQWNAALVWVFFRCHPAVSRELTNAPFLSEHPMLLS